ncbi:MAG: enoyl-CoA hydratase, partial [Caulobacteraceae bacterium]|nr:enoyl-CoA hydratase [Caulobacteraceae bacterium]
MATVEVITERCGEVAYLRLNRPQALNALTLDMCEAMTAALLAWRADPAVRAVIIDHLTERGYCAGGDVRAVAGGI